MDWCKLYARLPRDMALRRAGEPALVLFVFGLCHCAEEETDGFIADDVLPTFALSRVDNRAAALVAQGLWERVEGGFTVPKWQPLQRELFDLIQRRRKDADRARMKRKMAKEKSSDPYGDASTDESTDSSGTERREDSSPNPADAGNCPSHKNQPHPNCRGCGTNPRAKRQQAKADAIPPLCGECGPGRMIELDDDTAARCPRCHPALVSVSA